MIDTWNLKHEIKTRKYTAKQHFSMLAGFDYALEYFSLK